MKSLLAAAVMVALTSVSAAMIAACAPGDDDANPQLRPVSTTKDDTVTASSSSSSSSSSGGPGAATVSGLPCDVEAVLKTRCQTCHSSETKYGASAPLTSFDDLMKPAPGALGASGKKVIDVLAARIKDDARPMPPQPNPRLDTQDLQTIDKWIASGAKASTEACAASGATNSDGVRPLSCKPDTVIKAAKPFVMQQGSPIDQYVCFGIDVTREKKRHIVGFGPKVDNKKILHHILVFQSPTAVSAEPTPCAAFGSASWKLVTGWAPGGANLEAPPEAGFPEEKGTTHWVMQLHYNNALNLPNQTDQSGYELCTTEQLRPNDAGVVAFGSTSFTIPPRSTHTVSCDYRIPATFKGATFFNASPHMHTRGTSIGTTRLPNNGTGAPVPVFEQKAFDFQNQSNFPITGKVEAGDVMRTRCSWKNTDDNNVTFGEGTGDEMCFNFIGYYPNVPDVIIAGVPLFSWITPSATASCTAE